MRRKPPGHHRMLGPEKVDDLLHCQRQKEKGEVEAEAG